jgi:hypothetical protein
MAKNRKIEQAYKVCLNNPCRLSDEEALAYFNKAVDSQVSREIK